MFGVVEEEGEKLLLGLHLGDLGVGGGLDDGDVLLVYGEVVEEPSPLETKASILDHSVMGGLQGVHIDLVVVLKVKTKGGVVENGGIGRSAVSRQETIKKSDLKNGKFLIESNLRKNDRTVLPDGKTVGTFYVLDGQGVVEHPAEDAANLPHQVFAVSVRLDAPAGNNNGAERILFSLGMNVWLQYN